MIPDNGQHVITYAGKYGTAVYTCTLANAAKLLDRAISGHPELQQIAAEYAESLAAKGPVFVTKEWLASALDELLEKDGEANLPRLRTLLYGPRPRGVEADADQRPLAPFNEAWQQELVLWCFKHKIPPSSTTTVGGTSIEALMAAAPLDELSFLAHVKDRLPRGIRMVDQTYLDTTRELRALQTMRWKENAKEARIISQKYLPLLNSWAEGSWDVVEIQQTADD